MAILTTPNAHPALSDDGTGKPKSPLAITAGGWQDVAVGAWQEAGDDNIGLIAAGVSFYGFLALVPMLGAIVLSYGLIAEPKTVLRDMNGLVSVMPADAAKLVGEQLMNIVKTSGTKKGLGLALALAFAIFGARNGAGSIVTALNIAYEEKETRSFIRLNLLALAMTAASVGVAIVAMVAIAALGHLQQLLPGMPGFVLLFGKLLSYAAVALGGAAGAATVYRYAPDRATTRWVWLTPGSLFAAVSWLILTLGFGIYVAQFGNYNATYGSLGVVVVMLTWLYLSSYVLLLGAELNSELERRVKDDAAPGDKTVATLPVADHAAAASPHAVDPAPSGTAQGVMVSQAAALAYDLVRPARFNGPAILALGGLTLLRRRDRAPAGLGLLAAGGLLAWLSRG